MYGLVFDFRGYALYLLVRIFAIVTSLVAIYDFILEYYFDSFVEIFITVTSLILAYLQKIGKEHLIVAHLFFWQIAISSFLIVADHNFDTTVLFFVLTPIIAILVLPSKIALINIIIYEIMVSGLLYYGYHSLDKPSSIIFSETALINYISGTMYLLMFWIFYHISVEKTIQILSKLYKQKTILLQELHHRVKNNFNLVLSLLRMQYYNSNIDNKDFLKYFTNRIEAIVLAHELLYSNKDIERVNMKEYLSNIINSTLQNLHLKIPIDVGIYDNCYMSIDRAIYIGIMLNEMINNTIKYADIDRLKILFNKQNSNFILIYEEIGEVKEQKSNDEGFGIKLIKMCAQQLEASIDISNKIPFYYKVEFSYKEFD